MNDPRPPHQQATHAQQPVQEPDFPHSDEFFGSYPPLSVLSLGLLWVLGYQLGVAFLDGRLGGVYAPILLSAGLFHFLNPALFLRRQQTPALETLRLGLSSARQIFWLTLLTLCLLPAIELLAEYNTRVVPVPEGYQEFLDQILPRSTLDWLLAVSAIVVVAPLGEEIVFRGFMQQAARSSIGPRRAALSIGVFFALIHLQPHHLLPLAFLGIALGFIFERTGNLLATVWVHALYNGIGLYLSSQWSEPEVDIPPALFAATAAIGLGLAALCFSQLRREQPWTLDPPAESSGDQVF